MWLVALHVFLTGVSDLMHAHGVACRGDQYLSRSTCTHSSINSVPQLSRAACACSRSSCMLRSALHGGKALHTARRVSGRSVTGIQQEIHREVRPSNPSAALAHLCFYGLFPCICNLCLCMFVEAPGRYGAAAWPEVHRHYSHAASSLRVR